MKYNTIRNIMAGATIGTMFTPLDMQGTSVEVLAKNSRGGSRRLCGLEPGTQINLSLALCLSEGLSF